jgi:hypothetical protein
MAFSSTASIDWKVWGKLPEEKNLIAEVSLPIDEE